MAVNLEGNIIINGKVGSGFDSVMAQLHQMQAVVEMLGGPIREWEEESIEIYRDYETNMLQARAALSDQYTSYNELNKVMDTLEKNVQEWAVNSVFHVSDFSDAVNNASHAGWNLEQQLQGIPRAMLLAQAGNMDLADGLSYLARALNVTGTDFEDSGVLVDQWVKASHLANLTIEDLGQSLERMGVSAQFTNDTAELFTMLDTLAQTGVVGAQAGTLLRGTILRLIAPTKKAQEMMEQLEVTQEEYNELAGDSEAIQKTNEALSKTGFSAYTSAGKMKPMMQIYDELYDALVQIAGSEEDLLKDDTVAQIISTLFPTRTISGALAFLQGVKGGWHDLYDEIVDSEGAAEHDSETVMSGLMGAQERFLSKWEEFSRKVGEELSGPLETIYGFVGGLIDKLNELPEEQISALVGGLTALAETGPLLGVGTGIYKFFNWLPGWGKAALFAAIGVGALAGYLTKVSEINFKDQFGDLDVDIEALQEYTEGLKNRYTEEQEAVGVWKTAVDEALANYTTLTTKLNESLLQDVITGKHLDPTETANLIQYGEDIITSVKTGIENAQERDLNLLDVLFQDVNDDEQMDALDFGFALDNAYYESIMGQAEAIGEELRAQLVAALQDGTIDENERQAIQATQDRLNQIMQEIANQVDAEAFNNELYKAQHVSAESIEDYWAYLREHDAEIMANIENDRAMMWAHEKTKFDYAVEHGTEVEFADGTKRMVKAEDWDAYEAAFMSQFDSIEAEAHRQTAALAEAAATSLYHDSRFGSTYNWLAGLYDAGQVTDSGSGFFTFGDEAYADLSNYTDEQLAGMLDNLRTMADDAGRFTQELSQFGDDPAIARIIDLFASAGDAAALIENEQAIRRAAQENTAGGVDEYGRTATEHIGEITDENALRKIAADMNMAVANGGYDLYSEQADRYNEAIRRMRELGMDTSSYVYDSTDDWYADYLEARRNESEESMADYLAFSKDRENERLEKLKGEKKATDAEIEQRETRIAEKGDWKDWWYNFTSGPVNDYTSLHGGTMQTDGGLYGKSERLDAEIDEAQENVSALQDQINDLNTNGLSIEAEVDTENVQSQLDEMEGRLHLPVEGESAFTQLIDQGINVDIIGDTGMLDADIAAEDGQTLMQYVNGDTEDLHAAIYAEDGQTLLETVDGNADALGRAIEAYNGKTVHVNIVGTRMFGFAEGGRTTEPAIFGEVPGQAEWAIPEAHTERTAELLNAAREASGFTWGDIIGRFGGLNADPNHVTVNLSYAPTINAANADGVSGALDADKPRIMRLVREAVQKAMDEARLHEDLEVYA